jgi:tetratricopeptide (TPR) repeat protein/outer membrane protein assembly factor BamD (BamD/ComL family)
MNALVLALALGASPAPATQPRLGGLDNPILSKVKEHEDYLAQLKRNIFKVDRSILETERLIGQSRSAPYLPDLQFRLAELYVEKSRYVYYLQAEQRPEGAKGPLVSPETKLLKQKALQLYNRLLREWPDFKDGDKVMFYLAHEQRELGEFDDMLKTLGDLIHKYPQSVAKLEAEQILGDYYFDKSDLVEAEKHYQAVLAAPASAVHDLARYKMGWIRINQGKHAEAVPFFEAAAASEPQPGVDPQKALNVKREALLDLVYSYTESRPAKGALQYFEKLSESRATYALVLEKLGNRYFIKQQYEYSIPALRKLMEIQPDPEMDLERSEKLYDALRAAKGAVLAKASDIAFLVRTAVGIKQDPNKDERERKKQLSELEELARDLSTQLHLAAQKADARPQYVETAEAYKVYLSLFRPEKYVRDIMRNRADALFAAREYPQAARQFEELAQYEGRAKNVRGYEAALYGSLLAHYSALKPTEADRVNAFEVADARQALKLNGSLYVTRFPQSEHATEVKFNIARAYYEDGDFEKASQLFTTFALQFPDYKDAATAGNLALDALRQVNDFKGIEVTGNKFLQSGRLPQAFLAQVRKILTESKSEALGELALKSSEETGDVVEGLMKVAEQNRGGEIGEKALYGAFAASRDKRDYPKLRELGNKLAQDYPRSHYLQEVLLTIGRQNAEAGRFDEAAASFELLGQRLGADATALDGWLAGARLRIALDEQQQASRDLEVAAELAGARKTEVLVLLAQQRLKQHEAVKARQTAELVLKLDKTNAAAAAVLTEGVVTAGGRERPDDLIKVLSPVTNGPTGQSEDSAKALWYLGELLLKSYKALPADQTEQKVNALKELEGIYTKSASMGSPEWAVASLWKLGVAYGHLADVVEATPVPAGLNAQQTAQFHQEVQNQVAGVRQQSEDFYKACITRSDQLEVFSNAVIGCRTKSDQVQSPLPASLAPRAAAVAELQRKAEQAQDAASMESLGLAYLDAHQVHLAHLALARATELEDNRATAHNALGVAMLNEGDPMGAHAEFAKALEADPTLTKARANLASLRCRYGDPQGAKRELSLIKDQSALGAPDVDPGFRGCQ